MRKLALNFMKKSVYEKCQVMVEGDQTVHTSRHCIIKEHLFSTKRWSSVVRVNMDDLNELIGDDDQGFIVDETEGGSELQQQPAPSLLRVTAIEDVMNESQMEAAEEHKPDDEDAAEKFNNLELTVRRTIRLKRVPCRIVDLAKVAIEDTKHFEKD